MRPSTGGRPGHIGSRPRGAARPDVLRCDPRRAGALAPTGRDARRRCTGQGDDLSPPGPHGRAMSAVAPAPIVTPPHPPRRARPGAGLVRALSTTDPKDIAILYLVTSFGFFLVGGLMALLMRAELARPGLQFLSVEQYNQLFTMHGTIMLLLLRDADRSSGSRTTSCRCRSARRTSRSRG